MSERVKIAVIEPQVLFRKAICALLMADDRFITVAGCNGMGDVETAAASRPDVILFDVDFHKGDPVEAIKKLGGADATVSLAVSPRAFEQAFRSLRRGGTLVLVALPADNYMQLPIFETVLNGINIVGSIVGTRLDLAEVFELHAAGKTRVIYDTRKLEDVNHSFEEIQQGRIPARLVFDIA